MSKIERYTEILLDMIKLSVNDSIDGVHYTGRVDDTKKARGKRVRKSVLGYCSYAKKEIVIDINHVNISTHEEIMDTILHEIAHARAYHIHGDAGHGRWWKHECRMIGCAPKAKANVCKDLASAIGLDKLPKWTLVYKDVVGDEVKVEKVGECGRKLKRLSTRYIPSIGRKTLGKLYHVDSKKWEAYVAGKTTLTSRDFVC